MFQRKKFIITLAGGLLLSGITGCVPAPQRESTEVQPASDVKITIDPSGKTEVKAPAKTASENPMKETTPSDDSEK